MRRIILKKINQLKAGIILSYVNLLIATIIPFLYTPIMLRILGQEEYGLYSLSNSVIGYLSLLTLGMGSAISRYYIQQMAKNDREMMEKTAGLFVAIYGVISLVTLIIGFGITFFSRSFFAKGLTTSEIDKLNTLLCIMTVSTSISLVTAPFSTVVACHEEHVFLKLVGICGTILTPVLYLVALYAGYASVGMAVCGALIQLGSSVATTLFCLFKVRIRPRFRNLPWGILKEIIGFSVFVFIGMIADMLYWATDKILIGAIIGSAAVGIYNVGVTFNSILQQISSAISSIFAPRISRMVFSNATMDEMSDMLIRLGRIQYLIVSLTVSGFAVFGRDFLTLWSGEGYEEAYSIALLTMIPMIVPLIMNVAFNVIVAQNRHQFRSIVYVTLAVCNAFGTYLLIPYMGIVGAALCTFIVFLLGHGIIINWFYYTKIKLDIPRFWKNILKMSTVPVGMSLVFLLAQSFDMFHFSRPLPFLLGVMVYTAVFCLLSWLFTMNRYEKDLILVLFRKILPRK